MGSTTKASERKIIFDLTNLLKKNSDKLLSGGTNLCLTTSSLSVLAINFRRFSENAGNTGEAETSGCSGRRSMKKDEIDLKTWQDNIRTLMDFVWKVKALKIIHGSYTMKAPIQIHRFRSLQVLEVKRVPIHMIQGLSKLRGQLKEIIVSKSLQTLKDLLEICGGDRTPGLVWPHLKTAYFSYNSLNELDVSLSFVPFVEALDVSHNAITKTEDCLLNLLDLKRINLGYNMLKSVPLLSSVNKLKLKTLVLRNNNLENLDGIEELVALEELDVSENFLLDHIVLQGLIALKRLQVLCLVGNPMYYKPDHRILTLQYIYPQTGLGVYLLDGKRLTSQEILVLQENQYMDRYVDEDSNGTGATVHNEPDSRIGASQLNPHDNKKKHGHRRKRSKGRLPKIANIEDSLEDGYPGKSLGNCYAEDCVIDTERQEDVGYYETMREHFKDDWLNALSAKHGVRGKSGTVKNGTEEKAKVENTGSSMGMQQCVESELRNTDVLCPMTSPATTESNSQLTIVSSISDKGGQIGITTDEHSSPQSKSGSKTEDTERKKILHMYSYDAPASPTEDTCSSEQYDTECEGFIMRLADEQMNQLIVTVDERFIIERDLSGNKIAALDLKSIKRIVRTEEKCYGKDMLGCFVIILTIDFDYVSKDKRQRRYAVESEEEAQRFESLTSLYIKSVKVDRHYMQCLKCHHEFEAVTQDSSAIIQCLKCQSTMVIETEKLKMSVPEKTEDKETKLSLDVERQQNIRKRSNVWRSTTIRRRIENASDDMEHIISDRQEELETSSDRHSDIKDEFQSPTAKEMANTKSVTEISSLRNNLSCSDVQKYSVPKSGALGSVSSLESDITILAENSSRGSIAVISESSNKQHKSPVTSIQENKAVSDTNGDTSYLTSEKDILNDNPGMIWTKAGERLLTPVGSPLSNSVCSSMVSSVYENTITGNGEDVPATGDDVQVIKDDDITDCVTIRHSKSNDKNRQSNNRNLFIYDESNESGILDSNVFITVTNSSIKEISIYDTSDTSEKEETKYEDAVESTAPSIYDNSVYDSSVEISQDESSHLLFSNASCSHDDSLTNQVRSDCSSQSRRMVRSKSRSRSRSRSQNRSAIYVEDDIKMSDDFPTELSSSRRESVNDQSSELSEFVYQSPVKSLNETVAISEVSHQSFPRNQLPWEQSGNQPPDKSRRDESLNHDELVNIDHKIKLHLELQVFNADETAQCAIQCDIVQYMKKEIIKSLLVISTHRIIIFRIEGESAATSDWLKSYENQPITELRYIDIGLGYQTLRLEFETECSSYTLLIADEGKCKQFLTLLSDIVAHSDHGHLEGIGKSNPATYSNLESQVLTTDDDTSSQQLVSFLMLKYTDTDTDERVRRSLAITWTDLVLIDENHQWPLSRLQAPLPDSIKGKQFAVVQREKINNIGTLSFNEFNPKELQLSFLEPSAVGNALTWIITFETMKGVKSFVDAIRAPWEQEFGVSLDITCVSFTDLEKSS